MEGLVSMAICARNSKVECLPTKQDVEIAKFSERFVSMPVLSGRAACNSQYAGALPATGSLGKSRSPFPCAWRNPRHGIATEPMNFGVGGYHCSVAPHIGVQREGQHQNEVARVAPGH